MRSKGLWINGVAGLLLSAAAGWAGYYFWMSTDSETMQLSMTDGDGAQPKVVSETQQADFNKGMEIKLIATEKRLERLKKRSQEMQAELVRLKQAPTLSKPPLVVLNTDPGVHKPGSSAYQHRRDIERTSTGMSRRALEAYTRETGIDPAHIEYLMRQ